MSPLRWVKRSCAASGAAGAGSQGFLAGVRVASARYSAPPVPPPVPPGLDSCAQVGGITLLYIFVELNLALTQTFSDLKSG